MQQFSGYKLVHWIQEAIAPARCVGCSSYGGWQCDACGAGVVRLKRQYCYICGVVSEAGATCARCKDLGVLDGVWVACEYSEGWIRSAIHSFKYNGNHQLVGSLSRILNQAIPDDFTGGLVVGVPSHWSRVFTRGFNQAEQLAMSVAVMRGWRFQSVLKKAAKTRPQVGLRRELRLKSVIDTIVLEKRVTDHRVIIVDDVMTTGATLEECAKVLRKAGVSEVYGLVLARSRDD